MAYSEPCHTSKMKNFVKSINGFPQLIVFDTNSILDIWQGFDYVPGLNISDIKICKNKNQQRTYKNR